MESLRRTAKPIPDGYHAVTPYLAVAGVPKLIDFLKQAFGAKELKRLTLTDGTIWHAEVSMGDSVVMMAEAKGEWKPMPSMIYLYTEDTDAAYKRALKAGAMSFMEPADHINGDRGAGVKDPIGNYWLLATHKEDVSPKEIERRARKSASTTSA